MLQISLKAARVNAGLKQREAARLMNVDVATIISWEKNKTSPKATQLNRLSGLYGVPIDCIFLPADTTISNVSQANT